MFLNIPFDNMGNILKPKKMILKVMGSVNFACSKVILKSMIILNGERLEGGTKDGEIGEKQIFDLAQRL